MVFKNMREVIGADGYNFPGLEGSYKTSVIGGSDLGADGVVSEDVTVNCLDGARFLKRTERWPCR